MKRLKMKGNQSFCYRPAWISIFEIENCINKQYVLESTRRSVRIINDKLVYINKYTYTNIGSIYKDNFAMLYVFNYLGSRMASQNTVQLDRVTNIPGA